jgi:hypothetical protein
MSTCSPHTQHLRATPPLWSAFQLYRATPPLSACFSPRIEILSSLYHASYDMYLTDGRTAIKLSIPPMKEDIALNLLALSPYILLTTSLTRTLLGLLLRPNLIGYFPSASLFRPSFVLAWVMAGTFAEPGLVQVWQLLGI